MEVEFHEAFLLVPRKRAEDFDSILHVVLVSYPAHVHMHATNDAW